MKYRFTLLIALSASSSWASTDQIQFSVPTSSVANTLNERTSNTKANGFRLESSSLRASTWVPTEYRTESTIENATAFQGRGIPSADLVLTSNALIKNQGMELKAQAGAGVLALQRTASLAIGGAALSVNQELYLASLRAGAKIESPILRHKWINPWVSVSALPTLALAGKSAIEDGSAEVGLAGEVALGSTTQIAENWGLELGGRLVKGQVNGGDLSGAGAFAGLQVSF